MPSIPQITQTNGVCIQANFDHIDTARSPFIQFLTVEKLPYTEKMAWKLAITESLSNAIRHGSKPNSIETIQVQWTHEGNLVTLFVEDQGSGPLPKHMNNPQPPEDPYSQSGRGMFLINHFADLWQHAKTPKGYRQTIGKFHQPLWT